MNFWKDKKIVVTGGVGFVGCAVVRKLHERGVEPKNIIIPRSKTHDLKTKEAVQKVVNDADIVIHLAAHVGGIGYNNEHSAEIYHDNVLMAQQLIHESYRAGVKKFVGIGTIYEYPSSAAVPLREEDIWNGYPDEANAGYALAKRFMLAQSQLYKRQYDFNAIHLVPVKIYGPGLNFNPETAEVIASLILRIKDAITNKKESITVWGSGKAVREFLYIDDAAEAILRATEFYNNAEPINIGNGVETSITTLVNTLSEVLGFTGTIEWDTTKPEGQLRSVCDPTKAKNSFDFVAETRLEEGLKQLISWYETGMKNT